MKVKETTKRKLIALAGNYCAFSGCNNPLVDETHKTIIMEAAHIKGEKPDAARYDVNQSEEDRISYGNLIPLCRNCHKIIDDPANLEIYTTEKLLEMKTNHEKESTKRSKDVVPANLVGVFHATYLYPDKEKLEINYWKDIEGDTHYFDDNHWEKISKVKTLGLELLLSLEGNPNRPKSESLKIIYELMDAVPEAKFRDFIRLTTVIRADR